MKDLNLLAQVFSLIRKFMGRRVCKAARQLLEISASLVFRLLMASGPENPQGQLEALIHFVQLYGLNK